MLLNICSFLTESSPSPTDPSPSSDQSTVIIASVVASVGFILLVVVAIMTVLVVCLRRAQKTVNLNRFVASFILIHFCATLTPCIYIGL